MITNRDFYGLIRTDVASTPVIKSPMMTIIPLYDSVIIEQILVVSQINYVRKHGGEKCRLHNEDFSELTNWPTERLSNC